MNCTTVIIEINSVSLSPSCSPRLRGAERHTHKKMTLASFLKKNEPVPSPHQSEAGKIQTELVTQLLTPEADLDTDPLQTKLPKAQ